jgi:undecaprenyl-diphosphatase
MLSLVAAGPGTLPGDVAVTRFVQGISGGELGEIVRFMNALGQTPIMLTIGSGCALVLLARRRPDAALLIVGAMLMRIANPVLKTVFASPRPTTGGGVRVEEIASGFGFPSGHVMGMTLFTGALVCLIWEAVPGRRSRIVVLLSAAVVLLASGVGRIAVGAHWPSDVLGGYLWGGLGVAGLAWWWRTAPRFNSWRSWIDTWRVSPAQRVSAMTSVVLRRWRTGALVLGGVMAIVTMRLGVM